MAAIVQDPPPRRPGEYSKRSRPPDSDAPRTRDDLELLRQAVIALGRKVETSDAHRKAKAPDSITTGELPAIVARSLAPWKMFAAGIAIVFGSGIAYQQFAGGNATKNDTAKAIADHTTSGAHPDAEAEIAAIRDDLAPVKTGVAMLVARSEAEREIRQLRRALSRYELDLATRLRSWGETARTRRGERPSKSPRHLQIEEDLAKREAAL